MHHDLDVSNGGAVPTLVAAGLSHAPHSKLQLQALCNQSFSSWSSGTYLM